MSQSGAVKEVDQPFLPHYTGEVSVSHCIARVRNGVTENIAEPLPVDHKEGLVSCLVAGDVQQDPSPRQEGH